MAWLLWFCVRMCLCVCLGRLSFVRKRRTTSPISTFRLFHSALTHMHTKCWPCFSLSFPLTLAPFAIDLSLNICFCLPSQRPCNFLIHSCVPCVFHCMSMCAYKHGVCPFSRYWYVCYMALATARNIVTPPCSIQPNLERK